MVFLFQSQEKHPLKVGIRKAQVQSGAAAVSSVSSEKMRPNDHWDDPCHVKDCECLGSCPPDAVKARTR